MTSSLYELKVDKDLVFYILFALFPLFVFQFINLYYLYELDSESVKQINKTGIGYIIPNISVMQSKKIIDLLTLLPFFGIIFYFYQRKVNFYTILKVVLTPIVIYYSFYLIIHYV